MGGHNFNFDSNLYITQNTRLHYVFNHFVNSFIVYIMILFWPTGNSANFMLEHKDNWITMQGIVRKISVCWFFWHTFSSSLSWLLPRDKDLRSSRASRPSKTVILLLYKERSTSLVNVLKFSIFSIWLNERSATISSDLSSIQSSSSTIFKLHHQCSRWVRFSMHLAKSYESFICSKDWFIITKL